MKFHLHFEEICNFWKKKRIVDHLEWQVGALDVFREQKNDLRAFFAFFVIIFHVEIDNVNGPLSVLSLRLEEIYRLIIPMGFGGLD